MCLQISRFEVVNIRFFGYLCKSKYVNKLEDDQWIEITAEMKYERLREYRGKRLPVLYAKNIKVVPAPPKEKQLVYFN
jgi:uncharacterized membrane protein YcgQ (UPF0703/DUF1980 family)